MFCNDCCKVFCPRRSIDITYCDQKLTYVQAGIIDQPERKDNEQIRNFKVKVRNISRGL